MPAAIAIPALISAGTSIAGGVMQHRAAGQAQDAQVNATEGATRLVNDAVGQVNPQLTEQALTLGNAFRDVANSGGAAVRGAGQAAGAGVTAAAQEANGYLNPYINVGSEALTKLGALAGGPGFQFSEDDPSYKWRLQQGQEALEASQAARGIRMSGGMLKELNNYAQGAASTEYAAAFDRYMKQRTTDAGIYSTMAGLGLTAGSRAGDNLTGAARYAGDMNYNGERYAADAGMEGERFASGLNWDATRLTTGNTLHAAEFGAQNLMDAGNARAAGAVARGNAWNGIISGVGNAAGQAYTMRDLYRGGAPAPGTYPTLPSSRPGAGIDFTRKVYAPYASYGA